jgi:N-acetylglucosaminyldiphosphoundecaprenol N-acetyl-beta-D-mannosaminyltransferase
METVTLFGIPIRNIGFDDAVALIRECVKQGGSNSIFFFNAHGVSVAQDDPEYREILRDATHVFPDGIGVRIAGLLCGKRLRPDLNPTDLYPRLLRALQGTGTRVFLLGCEPGIAEKARERARSEYPGISICGAHHGYLSEEDEQRVIGQIREAETDILLVGMGVPKQEKWVAENLEATNARVAMGIGALFEYHSGKAQRAPLWMRRLGLEWLGRLIPGRGEPRRLWQRYLLGNFRFLWLAVVYGVRERWYASRGFGPDQDL